MFYRVFKQLTRLFYDSKCCFGTLAFQHGSKVHLLEVLEVITLSGSVSKRPLPLLWYVQFLCSIALLSEAMDSTAFWFWISSLCSCFSILPSLCFLLLLHLSRSSPVPHPLHVFPPCLPSHLQNHAQLSCRLCLTRFCGSAIMLGRHYSESLVHIMVGVDVKFHLVEQALCI